MAPPRFQFTMSGMLWFTFWAGAILAIWMSAILHWVAALLLKESFQGGIERIVFALRVFSTFVLCVAVVWQCCSRASCPTGAWSSVDEIQMNKKTAIVDLSGATAALLIGVLFMNLYSTFANIEIKIKDPSPSLPVVAVLMRDYSLRLLIVPPLAAAMGSLFIVARRPVALAIVCRLAWALALGLVCITLLAWQISSIPLH